MNHSSPESVKEKPNFDQATVNGNKVLPLNDFNLPSLANSPLEDKFKFSLQPVANQLETPKLANLMASAMNPFATLQTMKT